VPSRSIRRIGSCLVLAAIVFSLAGCATSRSDRTTKVGDIVVVNPTIPEPPTDLGSAYMTIRNTGDRTERLLRIESEAAGTVELHQTRTVDGRLGMALIDSVEIAPRGEFNMETGGFHVMLIDLKHRLRAGDDVPLTLTFQRTGTVKVNARVVASAGAPEPHRGHGG